MKKYSLILATISLIISISAIIAGFSIETFHVGIESVMGIVASLMGVCAIFMVGWHVFCNFDVSRELENLKLANTEFKGEVKRLDDLIEKQKDEMSIEKETQCLVKNKISTIETMIWHELIHAKYWEQFLSEYVSYKTDYRKWYNIALLVMSTIGASSFALWNLASGWEWLPLVLFSLMALAQLFSVCQKSFVIDDDTTSKIRTLRLKYIEYFNNMEKLYIEAKDGNMPKESMIDRYYKVREMVYPIEDLKDSLNISKLKKADRKGSYQTELYLAFRYGTAITLQKSNGLITKIFSKLTRKSKKKK